MRLPNQIISLAEVVKGNPTVKTFACVYAALAAVVVVDYYVEKRVAKEMETLGFQKVQVGSRAITRGGSTLFYPRTTVEEPVYAWEPSASP